ncbi:MAG: hypothetical protein OEW19_03720 [Acidobacteriota bacterium]|nr:hypothetical protein [Acidobacteriota bacterium]
MTGDLTGIRIGVPRHHFTEAAHPEVEGAEPAGIEAIEAAPYNGQCLPSLVEYA